MGYKMPPALAARMAALAIGLRLTQSCRLLRLEETQNESGVMENAYVPFGEIIPCRITESRVRNEQVQGAQVQAEVGMRLILKPGTKIDAAARVAVTEDENADKLRDGSLFGAQIWNVSGAPDTGRADAQFLSVPVVRVD